MVKYRWNVVFGIGEYATFYAHRVCVPEEVYRTSVSAIRHLENPENKWKVEDAKGINGHMVVSGLTRRIISVVAEKAGLPLPRKENFNRI